MICKTKKFGSLDGNAEHSQYDQSGNSNPVDHRCHGPLDSCRIFFEGVNDMTNTTKRDEEKKNHQWN